MPYNCPMARRRFQLGEEQIKGLTMAYATCKDGPTRTRFQAVRLYGIGYPVVQIMDITGCSRTSLMEWCAAYRQKESTALMDQRRGGIGPDLPKARSKTSK